MIPNKNQTITRANLRGLAEHLTKLLSEEADKYSAGGELPPTIPKSGYAEATPLAKYMHAVALISVLGNDPKSLWQRRMLEKEINHRCELFDSMDKASAAAATQFIMGKLDNYLDNQIQLH